MIPYRPNLPIQSWLPESRWEPIESHCRRRRPKRGFLLHLVATVSSRTANAEMHHCQFTFGGPSHNVDSLIVFGQGRQIFDFAFRAVGLNFPHPHMVVTTGRGQAAFAVWLKVGRVDWGILVMPIDDERRGLHRVACVLGRPSNKQHEELAAANRGGGTIVVEQGLWMRLDWMVRQKTAGSREGLRQRLDSEGFGLVGKGLEPRDSFGQQRLVMVKS